IWTACEGISKTANKAETPRVARMRIEPGFMIYLCVKCTRPALDASLLATRSPGRHRKVRPARLVSLVRGEARSAHAALHDERIARRRTAGTRRGSVLHAT